MDARAHRQSPKAFLSQDFNLFRRLRHLAMHLHLVKKNSEYCEPYQRVVRFRSIPNVLLLIDATGPVQLARLGVVASVLLNIVLVEFVYLNISAIPSFDSRVWDTTFPSREHASAPTFALLETINVGRSANLVSNATQLDALCDEKNSYLNPALALHNSKCLRNWQTSPYDDKDYNFVTFDGNTYKNLTLRQPMELWYAFTYKSTETGPEPTLELVALGPTLLSQYNEAKRCDLATKVPILASQRNSISLSPYAINDPLNLLHRTNNTDPDKRQCNRPSFRHYAGYNLVISPLGAELPHRQHAVTCNRANSTFDGTPCWSRITVSYSTLMNTTYTSKRGTGFKQILTEEGGIVGYITFFTWFFDMFAK